MKQSFAYRVLAVQSQRDAQEVAEASRDFMSHPDHDKVRAAARHAQEVAAHLYALARGRVDEAHGWEGVEP